MQLRELAVGLAAALGLALTAGGSVAATQGPPSVAALAAKLSPAVVNISSTHHAHNGSGAPFPKAPPGSDLNKLLEDSNPNTGDQGAIPEDAESLGSGFLVSANGTVVTNNHVINGADDIEVYLTDGTRLPAKVVGTDTKTDLAVLKVEAKKPLPFVEFGDSDAAEVGDWVMAIGNPFGLGGSVTLGIISARNRDIQSGPYDNFLQTDASINQGNSGGPLFDMNGKVVGINTAIIAAGGSSLGIGFAVPGSLAQNVVNQLEQYGETRRGWLGVGIQDVNEDIAAAMGRSDTRGAMVTDINADGPSQGIISEGDIILSFDSKPIVTMHDLPRIVAETAVGKAVPVTVLRGGKEQVLTIKLGRLEDGQQAEAKPETHDTKPEKKPASAPAQQTLGDLIGFNLAPIDAANRKTYSLPSTALGLVITSVKSGSDADEKGLIAGLVITEANQQKVADVPDVQSVVDAARKAGRTAMLFKVIDPAGQARFIGVKLAG